MAKLRARSGKVSRTAVIAWSVLSFVGCSAIAGLDGIQEQGCAPDCGDAAVGDSKAPGDTSVVGDSQQADTSPGNDSAMAEASVDSSTTVDSGGDSSSSDTGTIPDVVIPPDVKIDDAAFDGTGCGDLNTTANCGGCGLKCNLTFANQAQCCTQSACPGSTDGTGDSCTYTCQNGHLDCNAATPPDSDGCECAAPTGTACCGQTCPIQHTDGLIGSKYPSNPNFYDCTPAGTMNIGLAQDACAAYVTAKGGNAATNCGEFGPIDGGPPDSVCAITAGNCGSNCTGYLGDCICWTASGTYKGQVLDPVAQGLDNQCYTGSSSLTFN